MKTLELNQMECLQGGISCGGGFGASAAFMVVGMGILALSGPLGLGVGLYLAGAAGVWTNGVFNNNC